jgi:hypothetical protein
LRGDIETSRTQGLRATCSAGTPFNNAGIWPSILAIEHAFAAAITPHVNPSAHRAAEMAGPLMNAPLPGGSARC